MSVRASTVKCNPARTCFMAERERERDGWVVDTHRNKHRADGLVVAGAQGCVPKRPQGPRAASTKSVCSSPPTHSIHSGLKPEKSIKRR